MHAGRYNVTIGSANTIISSNAVHLTVADPPTIESIYPVAIFLQHSNPSETIQFTLTGSFSNMRDLDHLGRF